MTELTTELELEGLAREVVRRIQYLRKQADLNVDDRIKIQYQASPRLREAIENNKVYLQAETLAVALNQTEDLSEGIRADHEFDGEELILSLSRDTE